MGTTHAAVGHGAPRRDRRPPPPPCRPCPRDATGRGSQRRARDSLVGKAGRWPCGVAPYRMVMLAAVQLLAVVCAGLFAGAAVYITFVEHPARMECGTRLAATVWAPSYRRATWMQAPLAIVGALAGVAVWALGGGIGWLGGGVLIG